MRNPTPERRPKPEAAHTPDPPVAPPGDALPDPSEPLLREFAQRFLLVRREDLRRAQEWLAARSFSKLAQLGSQITGSGPTFGFLEVGYAGARMEAAARAGDIDGVESELETLRRLLGAS